MATEIQPLIEQRPYLEEPLRLYEKWQVFQNEAAQLLRKNRATEQPQDSPAYPSDDVGAIFHLFVSTFGLPGDEMEPLARKLEAGHMDFMRLPLDDFSDLLPSAINDEMATILFLFSKPFFQELRTMVLPEERQWEDGRCPLCSARPAISFIEEGPRRFLHCSWCGTAGTYLFTGCPNCGSTDSSKLGTLVPEEEPGFRVTTCETCRTYVKIVEHSILNDMTADLADLVSLPLDIVAQGKGYVRRTPNPIGLKKIE